MSGRKSKYKSKKVEVDGIKFDSKLESQYYKLLQEKVQNGEIARFTLQPRYLLQDAFKKNGKQYRKVEYVADFEVIHLDGTIEVVDVKGYETKDFAIKRKWFERLYDHKLTVITFKKKYGGWIELDKYKRLRRKKK
ncbi:DUF1064 domain-containing protein [Thermaerobacillus caldiproteolyticus]|uniref:DUF1064 domain-containing protein n=1 Tax=Thermaerobacillus caldiproteolyticus TaxID=247480 RepID=UPI0018F1FA99|nr:DUF1064 domain-containing protein [Anoxybacillus caldiproteolyticus]